MVILSAVVCNAEDTKLEVRNLDSNLSYIIYGLYNFGVNPGLWHTNSGLLHTSKYIRPVKSSAMLDGIDIAKYFVDTGLHGEAAHSSEKVA